MLDSSTAYKEEIRKSGRIMSIHDIYMFADGSKPDINTGSFMKYSINEATSDSSSFSIGATVIKKYSASLSNADGRFDCYDFEGLDIVAKVGLKLPDGSIEIIPKGRYRCVGAKSTDNTIDVEAYDSMIFFDKPYSESKLSYPATVLQIVQDACTCCQMTFNVSTIQNGDFLVQERPDDSSVTFRDVIGYCAQIMCCYAVIDKLDQLSFGWYDFDTIVSLQNGYDGGTFDTSDTPYSDGDSLEGGNFTDYSSGDSYDGGSFEDFKSYHHLYSLGSRSVNTDDVCITGIAVKPVIENSDSEDVYLYGEDGYALSIEENPLIQSIESAKAVASYIGKIMVGKKFRPLSISCQSNPCMEAGDCACVTDRKNRTYFTVITNTTFTFGSLQKVECTAETKTEKNYTKYSAVTRILSKAKKETENQLSDYNISVQHLTDLMTQSFGLFKTEEKQEDGSVIYYLHNKPELANSSTIWKMTADAFAVSTDGGETWNAGLDSEGNAVLNVLSAIGINFDWARGGTLKLGGTDNVDGVMEVYNADGKLVCKITKDGLETNSAKITGGTVNIATSSAEHSAISLNYITESGATFSLRQSPMLLAIDQIWDENVESHITLTGQSLMLEKTIGADPVTTILKPNFLSFSIGQDEVGRISADSNGILISGEEYGSNSNGHYHKFHDGTLICTKKEEISTTCNNAFGALYDSSVIDMGNWPMSFVDTPTIHAEFCTDNSFAWLEGFKGVSATSAGQTYLCRATDTGTLITGKLHITGVGRWR